MANTRIYFASSPMAAGSTHWSCGTLINLRDRGFCQWFDEVPSFVLAATVGLQNIALDEIPEDKRGAWVQRLKDLVQSKSKVLAGRASVTLFSFSQSVATSDILPELLSLYPVPDEGARRNI